VSHAHSPSPPSRQDYKAASAKSARKTRRDWANFALCSEFAEVLSDSTIGYDRGKKFWHYRHIESLETYVLISTGEILVEVYERLDQGSWRLRTLEGLDGVMNLDKLEVSLPLASLYEKTSLIRDP
jgi:Uma2 family endonuclease